MNIGEIESFFINKTMGGLFFPFFSVREISKATKTDTSDTSRILKALVKDGVLREYPYNPKIKGKRYQLNKEYFLREYTLSHATINQLSKIVKMDY